MYAIDPAVNVIDPNNPNGAAGGALLLNLDSDAVMTGVLATQSDATDVFNPTMRISFGGADDTGPSRSRWPVLLSDGVSSLTGTGRRKPDLCSGAESRSRPLAGTFAADPNNPGRSTVALTINGAVTPNDLVLYQASPGLNFFIDVDTTPVLIVGGYVEVTVDRQQTENGAAAIWPRHFYFHGSPIPKNESLKQTRGGSARRPNYLHPCPQCRGSHSFT